MDLFNSTLIPFIVMFGLSLAIILKIRKSRNRIHANNQHQSRVNSKDRKFAITSIALNIAFLAFNLPSAIWNLYGFYSNIWNDYPELANLLQYFIYTIFFTYYGINFYVQFFVNSVFRNQFLKRVKLKDEQHHSQTHGSSTGNQPRLVTIAGHCS